MPDVKQRWLTLRRMIPTPSLILGVLGWVAAAVFLMFWLFDVGGGPFSPDQFGSAGEWTSGLATAGTLGLAVFVLLRDRRLEALEKRRERTRAELREIAGSIPEEVELANEAKRQIPLRGWFEQLDQNNSGGEDSPKESGRYNVGFELYNGSAYPLASLRVRLLLTGDLSTTPEDLETRATVPSVLLCENVIVPPGQSYKCEMEDGTYYELPTERVNLGACMTAKWKVGDFGYDWSQHRDGATFLFARAPESIKKRERDARHMQLAITRPADQPVREGGTSAE